MVKRLDIVDHISAVNLNFNLEYDNWIQIFLETVSNETIEWKFPFTHAYTYSYLNMSLFSLLGIT